MQTRRSITLACLLTVAIASSAPAKPTPAQRCAAAKLKAAAVKIDRKLACHRAAVLAGRPVDVACLLAAETKFGRAMTKAESNGGCALTGDLESLEAACDACVDDVAGRTPVTTSTSTTTNTTTSTACSGPNGPCGSCGGAGVCTNTCDALATYVCVNGTLTNINCTHDDDCPAEAPICAPLFGCPNPGQCLALCP